MTKILFSRWLLTCLMDPKYWSSKGFTQTLCICSWVLISLSISELHHRRTSLLLLTIFHIHLLLMNFNLISVFIVLFCFLVSILLSRSCFVENSVLFCFPVLPFSLKSKKVFFPEVEFSIFCFQPKLQSSLEVWRAKLFHWKQRIASSHSFRLDGAIVVAWTPSTSTD